MKDETRKQYMSCGETLPCKECEDTLCPFHPENDDFDEE